MKITLENSMKMILNNNNYTLFFMSIVCIIIGVGLGYLANSQTEDKLFVLIFGLIFTLVGIYLLLTTKSVRIIIDKAMGKISISTWSLVKKESIEAQLSSVKKIILRIRNGGSGSRGSRHYIYELELIREKEAELIFAFGQKSASVIDVIGSPHQSKINEAKQIADFIGVPFEHILPPTLGEVVQGIREQMEWASKKAIGK
ncbi:MAG: hypothetical protein ACP5N9_06990 [Candidatus Bilamarchaeum sp.]|jgi:hypothetical protein